jgi:hypothetical protein
VFTERGHRVQTWDLLSPRLNDADVIVWFPDDFMPPSQKVCEWFDEWLAAKEDRTLIYVGRDFDAASLYWRKMAPQAPTDQKTLFDQELKSAEGSFLTGRAALAKQEDCAWFGLDTTAKTREVRSLEGPWSQGIDAKQIEIELNSRMKSIGKIEKLLTSEGDLLVGRQTHADWYGSQIILVANGSMFLNLPLVNHEHRKLASKLIDTVPAESRVVFLESEAGGPEILERDPASPKGNGLAILGVWPLSGFLLHLAVLGIIFCFARWPIFGRPRVPPQEMTADFGKHVIAMGELLARTRDRDYAVSAIEQWRDRQSNSK